MNARHPQIAAEQATSLTATAAAGESGYPARWTSKRRDFLRMHRQYVLGSDRRSGFDFALLTAGPMPAASFANLRSEQPPKM